MNKALYLTLTIYFLFFSVQTVVSQDGIKVNQFEENFSEVQVTQNLTSMSLSFTENQGQWDEEVKFRANSGGATMWFASDGVYYHFTRTNKSEDSTPTSRNRIMMSNDIIDSQPDSLEIMMIKANFVGANAKPQMVGVDMIDYKCNYFIGNDKTKWATDVPNYTAVMYEGIYDGIDLKYYGNGKQMEYDFIVSPGADFSQIKIQYKGAETVAVNENDQLVVTTKWGEVVEQRPIIYQLKNGSRILIDGKYFLQSDNSFSFELKNYDSSLPLVIDPVLEFSTYLGGSSEDVGHDIVVDTSGEVFIVGTTGSNDFPTFNSHTGTYQGGSSDVFVTKFSSKGNSLVYSTYLGGSSGLGDYGYSIALDSTGVVYITGKTYSSDFPTRNPFQASNLSGIFRTDLFVSKLSSAGNSLIYSTYLGGFGNDRGWSIDIDKFGAMYVTGRTESTNFPTSNPLQSSYQGGNWDAFVAKFNPTGDSLIFSTYLGGSDDDGVFGSNGIEIDETGSVYVMGYTKSNNFPTQNPYQSTNHGDVDVFVTKLNNSGDELVYSTYLGGSDFDGFWGGLTVDTRGNAYIMGVTSSIDFPTINPYQQTHQGGLDDIFVAKLNSSGDSLVYSTYLGGSGIDDGFCIEVDASECAYVIGRTSSTDFPTVNPYQESNIGFDDIFITKLNSTGNDLIFSTYLGGNYDDFCAGSALDESGSIYLTGFTTSTEFPFYNSYQDSLSGSMDAFVLKFSPDIQTDIVEYDIDHLPTEFVLSQNYPNPFNPTTTIEFNLPTKSNVTVTIYNLLGQEVQQLVNQKFSAGNYKVTWDGTSSNGSKVSTGMYLYRIESDNFVETKKMLLLK